MSHYKYASSQGIMRHEKVEVGFLTCIIIIIIKLEKRETQILVLFLTSS